MHCLLCVEYRKSHVVPLDEEVRAYIVETRYFLPHTPLCILQQVPTTLASILVLTEHGTVTVSDTYRRQWRPMTNYNGYGLQYNMMKMMSQSMVVMGTIPPKNTYNTFCTTNHNKTKEKRMR